jgi:hypothetical protein
MTFAKKWVVMAVRSSDRGLPTVKEWSRHWTSRAAERSYHRFEAMPIAGLFSAIIVAVGELDKFDQWVAGPFAKRLAEKQAALAADEDS